MKKSWFVAIFTIFAGIKPVQSECSSGTHHCDHLCLSTGKYNCILNQGSGHELHHGCECLPKDYCDHRYSCRPTDIDCSHNEAIRCNGNNKCECFCSQDSQCHNCTAGTLGFCVNEKCVCETNNYCPGGNKFYCLKNFQCTHNESKKCNQNDKCECFCEKDTDCKNCPEKGFCVDGDCVCESQDYCPKGNHLYCLSLSCERGYTSKCNSTNHCFCVYVSDTCSYHDVSKCYHLTCSPVEKKYCEGRTCTCKPLDYCKQNDSDCHHKTCDASKAEVKVCLSGTCGCLAIPVFCGGDDTSTCQHIICNQYQVKKCENGMCKCQVNPSCNAKEGLNNTCSPENTYWEVKGTDGKSYYANCTDSFHYPLCVEDRCQCVYWKTPPPPLTSEGSTIPTNSMTDVSGSTVSSTVTSQTTEAMTDSITPIPTDQTTASVPNTTQAPVPSTTSATTCASRMDCNQQNTHATFLTFTMPCPVDHIDCVNNKCFCSIDKITTSRTAGTTTQKVSTTTTSSTSVGSTASTTNTTPLSTSHPPLTTTTTTTDTTPLLTSEGSTTPVSSMTYMSASTVTYSMNTQTTLPMTSSGGHRPTAAICASRMDCNQQNTHATFFTFNMPCPADHIDCVNSKCFCSIDKITTTPRAASTTTTTTPVPTTPVTTTTATTHQTSGKPCPSCDANLKCVWNRTCGDDETCMVRGVLEHGFQFTVHCILSSDCHLMKFLSNNTAEIYCCDDRSCLQGYLRV